MEGPLDDTAEGPFTVEGPLGDTAKETPGDTTEGPLSVEGPLGDSDASDTIHGQGGVSVPTAEGASPEQPRIMLYRMLLREWNALLEEADAGQTLTLVHDAQDSGTAGLKSRLAKRILDRALPAAFAACTPKERVLLVLSEVEGMSPGEIGAILEVDECTAGQRLREAWEAMRRALAASLDPVEARLLEESFGTTPDELSGTTARGDALRRMVDRQFSPLPATFSSRLPDPSDDGAPEQKGVATEQRIVVLEQKIVAAEEEPPEGEARLPRSSPPPPSKTLQRDAPPSRTRRFDWKRVGAIILMVASAGLIGHGFSTLMQRTPETNLIVLSAIQATTIRTGFESTQVEEVERYLQGTPHRRMAIPTIEGTVLQGVSLHPLVDGVEVPVVLYRNTGGPGVIAVYVYSYAFLDAHVGRLNMPDEVLDRIEMEQRFYSYERKDSSALIWRRRDDIYVAIGQNAAGTTLQDRIAFPS